MKRIGVIGGLGKMGQETIKAVSSEEDMEITAVFDINKIGEKVSIGKKEYEILDDIEKKSKEIDIFIDFTGPDSVKKNAKKVISLGKKLIIGATGLSEDDLNQLEKQSNDKNTAVMVIPNFAIGAVLMMEFSKKAAKYLNEVEIIEYHHPNKLDAPSGTAIKTAHLINEVKKPRDKVKGEELIKGARGAKVGDIDIHSVRLNGYIASQEVIFGEQGQRLKFRHDSINRESFMPGVILAIKKIEKVQGLIYGLEKVL
ncbi:MAG: 4-hydroxy-tetrahydrodipicolinate reductase [Fusobacteriota bacterium]